VLFHNHESLRLCRWQHHLSYCTSTASHFSQILRCQECPEKRAGRLHIYIYKQIIALIILEKLGLCVGAVVTLLISCAWQKTSLGQHLADHFFGLGATSVSQGGVLEEGEADRFTAVILQLPVPHWSASSIRLVQNFQANADPGSTCDFHDTLGVLPTRARRLP